jgi:hypothetical protein
MEYIAKKERFMKTLLIAVLLSVFSGEALAQVNLSFYPMGNSASAVYLRNLQQPQNVYVPPPIQYSPQVHYNNSRNSFQNIQQAPTPTQRACYTYAGGTRCN